MHIIHIMHKFKIGGVESAVISAGVSDPKNITFTIGVVDKSKLEKKLSTEPIVNKYYKWNPYGYYKLAKIVKQRKPDILVCSLWRSVIVGIIAKVMKNNIYLILFFHNTKYSHWLDKITSLIGLRFCDSVFVDSFATKKFIEKYTEKSIYPISFLIRKLEPRKYRGNKNNKYTFLFFGRLNKQKRLDKALKLMFILKKHYSVSPKITIIGPDEGALTGLIELVKQMKLGDDVTFLPSMPFDEIKKHASNSIFYLQLSDYEGMGMSVVESMQMGLIPIVTPVGEIKRYVKHLENGIVFKSYYHLVIKDIMRVVESEELYEKITSNSIGTFSSEKIYSDDFFLNIKKI